MPTDPDPLNDPSEFTESNDDGEESSTPVKSTKRPTKRKEEKPLTKRQKIEASENELLAKAIACMDNATTNKCKEDGFDIFGRYVASELRAVTTPAAQRWAKLQNIFYDAQTEPGQRPHGSMEPLPRYNQFNSY